jgi:hypothetical protein
MLLPTLATYAVIHAALAALAMWVEWTPMSRISSSNVLDACSFFIKSAEFRLQAMDVLKHVSCAL